MTGIRGSSLQHKNETYSQRREDGKKERERGKNSCLPIIACILVYVVRSSNLRRISLSVSESLSCYSFSFRKDLPLSFASFSHVLRDALPVETTQVVVYARFICQTEKKTSEQDSRPFSSKHFLCYTDVSYFRVYFLLSHDKIWEHLCSFHFQFRSTF